MRAKSLNWFVLAAVLIAPLTVTAGHHYHGGHCMGKDWDMSAMDTDRDRTLSFEEYSQTKLDYLRKSFDRIDTNGDNLIDEAEWKAIREAHEVPPQE
jgi:hypothetical protein